MLFETPGAHLPRYAERQNRGVLSQLPPRRTRLEPAVVFSGLRARAAEVP